MANVNEQKKKIKKESETQVESEYSPKVERVYKIVLHIMSWVVGSAIVLVIVLFYFNSPVIDIFSQIIFYIGIITLISFLVIELIGNNVKNLLSRIIDKNNVGKNTTHR